MSNRGLGIKAKKCPYEVSNCTYGVVRSRGMGGMRSAERRKVNGSVSEVWLECRERIEL